MGIKIHLWCYTFRDTNIEVQTGIENLLKKGKAQTINHTFCFSGPGLFLLLYILEEYPLLAKALSNVSVLGRAYLLSVMGRRSILPLRCGSATCVPVAWVSRQHCALLSLSFRVASPPLGSWEYDVSRRSALMWLDCQNEINLYCLEFSCLFRTGKEGSDSPGGSWEPLGSNRFSRHEQWLSLVGLKKVALFYLMWNLVMGNTDLFCFQVFWLGVTGARECRLGIHRGWVRKILIPILS